MAIVSGAAFGQTWVASACGGDDARILDGNPVGNEVALATVAAQRAGTAIDANGLAHTDSTSSNTSGRGTGTTSKLGGDFAGFSIRGGDVYYFAFGDPSRIERYDLASRTWLASIPLQAAATALWADDSGIFVAEDRAVIRFALNGGARTPMGNAQATVTGLFTLNDVLVFGPRSGDLTTMNKRSGRLLSTISYWYAGAGFSVAPALNRAFFRSTNVSPSDIHYLEIGADGKLVKGTDSPYHGTYPSASRTFIFPNGARVVDDSGTVYATDSLTYNNSLGGSFTDMSFLGADVPIVLRGNKLSAYSNTLLEAGSFTLDATGLRVAVAGTDAVVFIADGANPHGLKIQAVALSQLAVPQPGVAIDPRGLAYTPDDVFTDKDGNLLLFCKSQLSLFRWSVAQLKYLPTVPLLGAPSRAGYSKENHRAYFAYDSQVVRMLDLTAAEPREVPLFNLPSPPRGFTLAGEFPYVAAGAGLLTFAPDGTNITTSGFTYYHGKVNTWDPVTRRVYHFRDGISPNDLHYDTISPTGQITGGGETPYHGDFTVTPPIRVSPDGTKVVIGSGVVFNASGLTKAAALATTFTDALWRTNELLTIRAAGTSQTQIQSWNASTYGLKAALPLFAGTPLRLLACDSQRSLLITLDRGMPRFYLLNADLSVAYDYLPDAPRITGTPPAAAEDMAFSWTPEVWRFQTAGPVTLSAPVLPAWLALSNGTLAGTPREADSGDQINRSMTHRIVLRALDAQGRSEDREFMLTVNWQNDAPCFTATPQQILANARADDSQLDLGALMSDPDGNDSHHWEIAANSNPAIFSSIQVNQDGLLETVYAPYFSGESMVTVQVTDASGASATATIAVVLPELPVPVVTPDPTIRLSRLTGLYEQTIVVRNVAARAIAGFDLTLAGLRPGARLYNGISNESGGGTIFYHHPLAAGEAVTLVLEYYTSPRGAIPPPTFAASVIVPDFQTAKAVNAAAGFAVNRLVRQDDGSVVIEFTSEPGISYRVQYSEDATHWNSCPVPIQAGGTKVQWIDRGPPWTDSSPASRPCRFYRVERLDP